MRTKLEKLLAAYEAERASLTVEMEECVVEMDYGKAHLFFKSLARVNQQLQMFHSLQDKEHDAKEYLAQSIKFLEERITTEEDYMRRYLAERIAEAKKKLAELSKVSAQKATVSHTVRDVLHNVLTGKITGFTLVLQESKRLHCYVKLVRKTLILTVPEIRRHIASYTLQKRHVRKFQSLGFRLYDSMDKLMLFAPYSTIADANAIQRVLARITFEVFYFKELAGETFIKYHP